MGDGCCNVLNLYASRQWCDCGQWYNFVPPPRYAYLLINEFLST